MSLADPGGTVPIRTTLRQVRWFPDHGHPTAYLLALVAWLPATIAALALLVEESPAVALGVAGVAVAIHSVPVTMYVSACLAQERSPVALWALRAQIWLLLGGGGAQAVRALTRKAGR